MKINLKHVAKLANLELSGNEIKNFEEQLSEVLNYIDNLQELNTENVIETSQTTGLENISREDTAYPSISQEEAISNTKSEENGLFRIKSIFEEQ